jgi:acetyltransferase-like isoleucine patch superfamily enzyme
MPAVLNLAISMATHWFNYLFRFRGNKVKYLRFLGTKIGDGCSIYNKINAFSEPWLIEIGNNVTLTSGVQLITHDGASRLFRHDMPGMNPIFGNLFGTVRILDNCFIGVNSIILPGIVIGPNSVVGAGSVVTHNVPPETVFAGNPAHFVCTLDEYKNRCRNKMIEIKSTDRDALRKELSVYFWQDIR